MRWSTGGLRKAHSLAVTAHGDLCAGKGWRGELDWVMTGVGAVPKVSGKFQFLKVAAGDRHTLAIALKHSPSGGSWGRGLWKRPTPTSVSSEVPVAL